MGTVYNCTGLSIPPGALIYNWHPGVHVKCDLSKTDQKWNENVNFATKMTSPPPLPSYHRPSSVKEYIFIILQQYKPTCEIYQG